VKQVFFNIVICFCGNAVGHIHSGELDTVVLICLQCAVKIEWDS